MGGKSKKKLVKERVTTTVERKNNRQDVDRAMAQINADELKELKEAFAFFDKNGDGAISTNELGTVMRALGQNPTELELQGLINEADVDCNGVIDVEEFICLMCQRGARADSDEHIREAFRVFDIGGNGYIHSDELRDVMRQVSDDLTDHELDEIMHIADPNNHGTIRYNR